MLVDLFVMAADLSRQLTLIFPSSPVLLSIAVALSAAQSSEVYRRRNKLYQRLASEYELRKPINNALISRPLAPKVTRAAPYYPV